MSKAPRGQATLPEILGQPAAWAATIERVEAAAGRLRALADGVDEVIFTGCGSALNASQAAAPTFQRFTGLRARAFPAAELIFYPETVFVSGERCLVVAISRSGQTTETVGARRAAARRGMPTLAITCYPNSVLAQEADLAFVLEEANERSVITTRSLTSMVLCGQLMAALVSGDSGYLDGLKRLPELGGRVIERYHSLGREIAGNEALGKFAFVGSGPYYGLARECQLKIKETTLLPSDCYPTFDFRHGPKSIVDAGTLVTLLMSDGAQAEEISFLEEMKGLGGHLLVLCDEAIPEVERLADYLVEVRSGLPDFTRDILYVPPVHFLAYYRSLLRGQDPDNPTHLTYWVALSGR